MTDTRFVALVAIGLVGMGLLWGGVSGQSSSWGYYEDFEDGVNTWDAGTVTNGHLVMSGNTIKTGPYSGGPGDGDFVYQSQVEIDNQSGLILDLPSGELFARVSPQNDYIELFEQNAPTDRARKSVTLPTQAEYEVRVEYDDSQQQYTLIVTGGGVDESVSLAADYTDETGSLQARNAGDGSSKFDYFAYRTSLLPEYNVSGYVNDSQGNLLANADITFSQNGVQQYQTTTNSSGGYSQTVEEGTYNVTASKAGYTNATGQVPVTSNTVLNFTLAESDKPYIGGGGTSNDGSTAEHEPRGGVLLDDQQTDLNFTVRDDSSSQINYTVFHINASDQFEEVGSGQVANNTRVSVPVTSLHGSNQWYVRVNDSINVQTSSVFRYRTPGIVTVFNGSSLNRLNDRTVDYVIRGANSNYRQEGSTSDGNISLNGVPDERLLVRANATDYYEQTIQVTNPARNYSLLLYPRPSSNIPGSDGNYQQSFSVNDLTGDFPASDSSLEVQARVNGEYQVVASDSFGAVNVATVTLDDGEEYRLAVRNDDRVRSMGDFTGDQSLSSEVVTLTVTGGADDGDLTTDPEGLWRYNASYNDSQQAILAEFDSNDTSIQSVRVKIYERGDEGNVIYDSNYGAVESLQHTQQLDNEQANKTWWVEFQVETNNTTQTARVLVGSGAQDPTGSLPDWIKLALSVIVIMMTGALFSQANIGVGMIVTPLVAGGFVLIGWTGTALTGGTVVVALTVGILVNYGGVR